MMYTTTASVGRRIDRGMLAYLDSIGKMPERISECDSKGHDVTTEMGWPCCQTCGYVLVGCPLEGRLRVP